MADKFTYIQSINSGMKSVNIQFIVLDIGPPKNTKDGQEVRTARVADASGSVDLAVWNEMGEALSAGDICRLKNGYSMVRKGCLSVSCGKSGELVKIGEFTMIYSDTPNVSEFNPNQPENGNSRKRSPPGGDDDKSGGGGGEGEGRSNGPVSGPPHKQPRRNGGTSGGTGLPPSGNSSGGTTQNHGAVLLNFPVSSKEESVPSRRAGLMPTPDTPPTTSKGLDTPVSKAGYRRMAPEPARDTGAEKHYAPHYTSASSSSERHRNILQAPGTKNHEFNNSRGVPQSSAPIVPLMNSSSVPTGPLPMNFFQRFPPPLPPPPMFHPNVGPPFMRQNPFQAQKIGGGY